MVKEKRSNILRLEFSGGELNRQQFLDRIKIAVNIFTGEEMTLDSLVDEIVKKIFDHADGRGSLLITKSKTKNGKEFGFVIKDEGEGAECVVGLGVIKDLAERLNIDLKVDTSKGYTYSGTYVTGAAGK